jgi:hypothetical protein
MSIVRAILVAFVALSVAMLPVAGGLARAMSPETSLSVVQADCCPPGKPCEKTKAPGDCGSMTGCVLKCFNFSVAIVSGVVVKPVPTSAIEPVLASLIVDSHPAAPPFPPPRV